jgi:GH24 family phage-related lysozyme (muramidase)
MPQSISPAGLAFIRDLEGFRADPAPLPDGNWVVGCGHVRVGQAGGAVSENDAAHLLALDLAPFETLVNEKVAKPLSQAQFDALVSFAFSVGAEAFAASQVLRRVNAGEFVAAACAMDAWRKSNVWGEAEVMDALVRRRAGEKAMFLADLPCEAAPSALVRAKLDYAASVLGAPIKCRRAPALRSAPRAATKLAPALRLVEILKSEPATEALLLTQIVAEEAPDDEITTAHAKPVSRVARPHFGAAGVDLSRSMENAGLIALMLFGIGLIAVGGSMWFSGRGDAVDLGAGAALATPGFAASLMAGFGLARAPQPAPA